MSWDRSVIAASRTHHIVDERPMYESRFAEVLAFHAPGLAPVRRGAEAWHIHDDGRAAYERRFVRTFGYYEGLAAVVGVDGAHHIATTGADLYVDRYAWVGNFRNERCTVRTHDGDYVHINSDGGAAYTERWRYAGDYRDGVAVVQADTGLSTHIDRDGAHIHAKWFLDLDVFHKWHARARDADGWMHIDLSGAPLYARRFAMVEPFYNGQARVERFDGGLEIVDEGGARVRDIRSSRVG